MKKSVLSLMVVAVLLTAAFALWLALDRSGRHGARPEPAQVASEPPPAPAPAPALADASAPVELAPADDMKAPAPAALAEPADAPDENRAETASSGGRRIRGRILVPGGAPEDDSLRVVALKEAVRPSQVYGTGGVLADLADGKKDRALGSASVAADGTFNLSLSSSS